MTDIKITDTQAAVLTAAADRPDGNIEPLPFNLRGGARTKVIQGLLARGLIINTDGQHRLTDIGYASTGKHRRMPQGTQNVRTPDFLQKLEVTSRAIRPGTKLAAIIDAMHNPSGATIAQMMVSTGWQAHTVRGAISGMVKKRLGFKVETKQGAEGQRTYRIV